MSQKWIKDFRCLKCQSSLGQILFNPRFRRFEDTCFVCEAPQDELAEALEKGQEIYLDAIGVNHNETGIPLNNNINTSSDDTTPLEIDAVFSMVEGIDDLPANAMEIAVNLLSGKLK